MGTHANRIRSARKFFRTFFLFFFAAMRFCFFMFMFPCSNYTLRVKRLSKQLMRSLYILLSRSVYAHIRSCECGQVIAFILLTTTLNRTDFRFGSTRRDKNMLPCCRLLVICSTSRYRQKREYHRKYYNISALISNFIED